MANTSKTISDGDSKQLPKVWYDSLSKRVALVHNLSAVLFFISLAAALTFYIPALQQLIGYRRLFREVHWITGTLALVVILPSLVSGRRSTFAEAHRRLSSWTISDARFISEWVRRLRRPSYSRTAPNGGQKVAYSIVFASMGVLLVSGLILRFFNYFPISIRAGATLAHDLFFYLVSAVVLGHIVFVALSRRDS